MARDLQSIKDLIQEIEDSEHRWKALYHATWLGSKQVKCDHIGIDGWEKRPVAYGLRASNLRYHEYPTGKFLIEILEGRDGEIALNHTIVMLSLLEKLVKEIYGDINDPRKKNND